MDDNSTDEGIGALIGKLADDAKAYGRAELAFARAVASARLRAARGGLVAGALGATLALAATVTLLVGGVMSLAPLIGPALATLCVVTAALAVATLLGAHAKSRIARAFGETQEQSR